MPYTLNYEALNRIEFFVHVGRGFQVSFIRVQGSVPKGLGFRGFRTLVWGYIGSSLN